jgi:hypothetical protein
MNPTGKSTAAYLRSGKIYLHPFSRTIKGFRIACEPILVSSADDKNLGAQLLAALAHSTENIPDPESLSIGDRSTVIKKLVKAAGCRSYEGFADSAQCVGVKSNDAGVEFTPIRNGGRGDRFLYLKTKIQCRPVEAEVAAALIKIERDRARAPFSEAVGSLAIFSSRR